jgi:hypothetical protein
LKKVNDIILSRAQKGFTNKRFIQECFLNITESIAYSEKFNIPGFVLALDMAKAFDMVKHDFIKQTYEFFGLGNNFINILETILTGRSACIQLDGGILTSDFELGTGFAQGNNCSPSQFNICEQLFIYKLEFSRAIEPIIPRTPRAIRPLITEERIYGKVEHDVCTGNAEAFADDSNVIGQATQAAIVNVSEIVSEFGRISGLKCNVDKSIILVTGTDVVPEFITQSGFKCADTINILGLEICRDLSQVTNNFNKPLEKIEKIAKFWNKFRLSLMGRITVAKSLLLSQLTYAGSILVPTAQQINKAETIINDFIVSDLRISKKMYRYPKTKVDLVC